MTISSFEQLCAGLCELHDVKPPALAPDENGKSVCILNFGDVTVTALAFEVRLPDAVYLLADLGPAPDPDSASSWLAMLDTNAVLLCLDAPRFACNPVTGRVLIQWACSLGRIDITQAYQRMGHMAAMAHQWRADPLLSQGGTPSRYSPPASALPPLDDHGKAMAKKFRALYEQLCEATGQSPSEPASEPGPVGFSVTVEDVRFDLVHVPQAGTGTALLTADFAMAAEVATTAFAASLIHANFALMSHPLGAGFCRDPLTGNMLARMSYPLDGASGQDCLARMLSLKSFGRDAQDIIRQSAEEQAASMEGMAA